MWLSIGLSLKGRHYSSMIWWQKVKAIYFLLLPRYILFHVHLVLLICITIIYAFPLLFSFLSLWVINSIYISAHSKMSFNHSKSQVNLAEKVGTWLCEYNSSNLKIDLWLVDVWVHVLSFSLSANRFSPSFHWCQKSRAC